MILKTIAKITNNFETGFHSKTLMGWTVNYDKEGRPLNCDPNFRDGTIMIEGKDYWFTRKEWTVKLWDQKADYTTWMSGEIEPIEELDLTPDYVRVIKIKQQ